MAQAAASESELWIVNVSAGQTRTMTLDELDEAFNAGLVNEATMVCEAGSDLWQPLYVVAGLEPPRPTTPGAPAPPPQAIQPETLPRPQSTPPGGAPMTPRVGSNTGSAAASFGAQPSSPPAGAPAPPRTQAIPRPGLSGPAQLPSSKTPPLPAEYMSHATKPANGTRPTGAAASSAKAATTAKASAQTATAPPKASLKATLPGAYGAPLGLTASPAFQNPALQNPALQNLAYQAPVPQVAVAPSPAPLQVAPSPAQIASLTSSPVGSSAATRSKVPPLPPNAFAHLAAEALAEVGAGPMVAPGSRPRSIPPTPVSSFMPTAQPVAMGALQSSPPPVPQSMAPQPLSPTYSSAPQPYAAQAPAYGAVAYAPAAQNPLAQHPTAQNAFAQSAANPWPTTSGNPDTALGAARPRRSKAEAWLIAGATLAGLLITLHRNSVLHNLSSSIGIGSSYEGFEKAVLGEPALDTPRGVQSLLQRTEKTRSKSAATADRR